MKKRLILSGIIFLVCLIVFIVFGALVKQNGGDPLGIDIWARDLAYNTRGEKGGFNYWFWRVFTECGDLYFIIALGVAALFYTRLDSRFMIGLIGAILEVLLNKVIKAAYQRPRPLEEFWWMYESSSSFPSGHSTATGFMYPFIIYIFLTTEKNKKIKISAVVTACILFFIVPVSRIVLGMHYFSDCVAGLALGGMVFALSAIALELLKEYNVLQKPMIPAFWKKKENIEDNKEN